MRKIIEFQSKNYKQWDKTLPHIMQSHIWQSFKQTGGYEVIYLADMDDNTIVQGYSLYITALKLKKEFVRIGIMTQSALPDQKVIEKLKEIGKKRHLAFIKIEPLVTKAEQLESLDLVKGKDYFLKNTYIIDLSQSIDSLFQNFSSSTRRNIRIAQKKGVTVAIHQFKEHDFSHINEYLKLQNATIKRKKFAVHNDTYYRTLYSSLKDTMVILEARYNDEVIASMILLHFNNSWYYPYGASLHKYIQTKAINLLVYEGIKYAKQHDGIDFNFWGALEEPADPQNPLYGTHMFKKGYGGKLVCYVGGYDLIINPLLYRLFTFVYNTYWNMRKKLR